MSPKDSRKKTSRRHSIRLVAVIYLLNSFQLLYDLRIVYVCSDVCGYLIHGSTGSRHKGSAETNRHSNDVDASESTGKIVPISVDIGV